MASGKEIHDEDLPPELLSSDNADVSNNWEETLRAWVEMNLVNQVYWQRLYHGLNVS